MWTPEQVTKLRELADQGLSALRISLQLDVTRNAIIGACHRYGVHLHGKAPIQRAKPLKREVPKPPLPRLPKLTRLPPIDHAALHAFIALPIPAQPSPPRRQCQWILPNGQYCGLPCTSIHASWCCAHRARAFIPRRGPPRRFE